MNLEMFNLEFLRIRFVTGKQIRQWAKITKICEIFQFKSKKKNKLFWCVSNLQLLMYES